MTGSYHITKHINVAGDTDEISRDTLKMKVYRKRYMGKNNDIYDIYRYDKNVLSFDSYNTSGLFRSLVVKNGRMLVFAPPKSMTFRSFTEKYRHDDSNLVAENYVEGTMINLFFNPKTDANGKVKICETADMITDEDNPQWTSDEEGEWELATRSTIGGNTSFYQDEKAPTFRKMFLEACIEAKFEFDELPRHDDNGCNYSYSFVLQHPDNRLVSVIDKPRLFLVGVYCIDNKNGKVDEVSIDDVKNWKSLSETDVQYAGKYSKEWSSYDSLIEKFKNGEESYEKVGLIIKNIETGERCKYRNEVYEEVRFLRGNQPKFQYQYILLRGQDQVKKFLKYYPEKRQDCERYRKMIHRYTETLYRKYCECYIKKQKPLIEFEENYRTNMYLLHKLYLDKYRENKGHIGMPVVIKFVNSMEASHLMHVLNYNIEKRYKTIKTSETQQAIDKEESKSEKEDTGL